MIRLFLLLALVWSTGAAQDGPPKTVKEIRQLYADTQKAIAMMDEEEHLRAQMKTTVQRNMPGSASARKRSRPFLTNMTIRWTASNSIPTTGRIS